MQVLVFLFTTHDWRTVGFFRFGFNVLQETNGPNDDSHSCETGGLSVTSQPLKIKDIVSNLNAMMLLILSQVLITARFVVTMGAVGFFVHFEDVLNMEFLKLRQTVQAGSPLECWYLA